MKRFIPTGLAASLVAACGLVISAGAAEDGTAAAVLTLDQVPAPVQETLNRQSAGQPITEIEKARRDGAVVYTARIPQRGLDRKISVSESGVIIADNRHQEINKAVSKIDQAKDEAHRAWDRSTGTNDPLTLEDLPKPAQERIRTEADGHDIAGIRGGVDQGTVYYKADIRFSDGSERQIKVSESGELMTQK